MQQTFQTPGELALDLRVPAGRVELETADGEETAVELVPLDGGDASRDAVESATVELRGHHLVVHVQARRGGFLSFGREPQVRLAIRCPHGAEVGLKTASADLEGHGRFGRVGVDTASGDVTLEEVAGDLGVRTASGDVRVERVGGEAGVKSASGYVSLDRVEGVVGVQLASGDLVVGEAGGPVGAQSASGDLRVGSVSEGKVELQSASGDVTVGIRRGSRLWVDASSMSGDTSSELEVGDASLDDGEGPLVELKARTMSGDIRVVRA